MWNHIPILASEIADLLLLNPQGTYMDGTLGFQAKNCIDFIAPLKNEYVILQQDERLSSETAENILKQKGKKYTKNKALVDTTAACVILENYIEENR